MPRRSHFLIILATVVATLAGTFVSAAPVAQAADPGACTITWDGGAGSTSWLDAANWTDDRLPTVADDACVFAASAPTSGVTLDGASNQAVNSLRAETSLRIAMTPDAGLHLVADSLTATLYVDSGYVSADASLRTTGVVQTDGAVGGAGAISVDGPYHWSGGQMYGSGSTTIFVSGAAEYGLYLEGGNELTIDQRLVDSTPGLHWTDDTNLSFARGGTLRTDGTSTIAAPGAYVDGDGTFDSRGDVSVAHGASVLMNSALAIYDDARWNLATLSEVRLARTAVVAGDIVTAPASTIEIAGDVRFTPESEISGDGILTTSVVSIGPAIKLDAEGTVHVGVIEHKRGSMTFHAGVTTNMVEFTGGTMATKDAAAIQAGSWAQGETEFRGTAYVTGDAALDTSIVGGTAGGHEVFLVGGELVISGDTVFDSIDANAESLTFTDPTGEQLEAGVYLQGDAATLDVRGTVSSPIDASVFGNPLLTAFHAGALDVTTGRFQADVPTKVGIDDTVNVAAGATLEMSNVEQRGTMSIAGTLELSGGATVASDIVATGDAAGFVFQEEALVDLVDGAAIGGAHAFIANLGTIAGDGQLIGVVSNGGMIETSGHIDAVGGFTQTDDGTILITVDGAQHGQIGVVGDASLAGALNLSLADGGTLPADDYNVVVASGTIDGQFGTVNGLETCATIEYEQSFVTVVPQPCVAVAAAQAQEDADHVDFVVSLSKPSSRPVVVHYGVLPGTADITDFVDDGPSSLTIPAGATSGTISVGLVDDDTEEPDETFTLTFAVTGGEAENAEATGTILDDDVKLDFDIQDIPVPGGIRWISALGTEYVLGTVSPDADTYLGWAYRISDDAFSGTRRNFMGNGMNARDQAVGNCGASACMRDHLVDTTLDQPSRTAGSADAISINDKGEIVGYIAHYGGAGGSAYTPARWADANAPYEEFSALGSGNEQAVDVNNNGVIVGNSELSDGTTRGWVRYPDGTVVDIGTLMGLPKVRVVGISDDGVVAGYVTDGELYSQHIYGFTWTAEHGMLSLGQRSLVTDIAPNGDMTGHIEARAFLWRDGRAIDLNKALDLEVDDGFILTSGSLINDQGTIVSLAWVRGFEAVVVLVPDGAGCRVCLTAQVSEAEFPRADYYVPAGDTIVEGNPADLYARVNNNDDVVRTVTVTFTGPDGQPMGDPETLTVAPGGEQSVSVPWNTEGLAWKDGVDAGPVELTVEMRGVDGSVLDARTFHVRVTPRPVVNVHGMNSDASTWAGYPAFVSNAHFGWQAFAVDTMNTKPWTPNTIAQNAALLDQYITKFQTEQNAWQVDLVAHSMGGLISRYYVQNLMQDRGGMRPARQLVMLGTPNAGSPCADLFPVPMTHELRTDIMRQFNAAVTDQRGVPFSIAAGNTWPATCNKIGPGDMVVPLDSALTGVSDAEIFPILHTDMTFSGELFNEFVLPRLNGQHQVASAATRTEGVAVTADADERALAGSQADEQPQLLQTNEVSVNAGATFNIPVQVPANLAAFGVTALGSGQLEVALVKSATVVATTGVDANPGAFFRTVSTATPASGSWTIRLINHGTTKLVVPNSVWVQGAANTLEARAEQVNILGTVKVTARINGPALAHPINHLMIATVDRVGDDISGLIYDDGKNGDAVAGDGNFTGTLPGLKQGPAVIEVSTDDPYFYRITTVGLVLTVGTDGPGNDAPIATPATATVPGGEQSRIDLEAADPEDQPITYHIVDQPAHGKLGGGGPFYYYLPNAGFMGTDTFTYRVHDGLVYSATATVTITVGQANAIVDFRYPSPPAATKGSAMHVVAILKGAAGEAVAGGDVTLTMGADTVTTTVGQSGLIEADVPVNVAGGRRDLVIQFAGNTKYAPMTYTQGINVSEGVAPMPNLLAIDGEAGYTTRIAGLAGDNDDDAILYEFDFDNDGTIDATHGPNGGRLTWVDHVFPSELHGQARLRVTDAAGHVAEAFASIDIAPHRELGALRRILVEGEPVKVIDASDDGRYVLYQVTDNEVGHQLPVPYGVLDRQTGTSIIVSVRADGTVEDDPFGGTLSPDGRTVAFSSGEWVDAFWAPQVYVRNLDTGVSVLASLNAAGQRADKGAAALAVTNGGGKVLFQSFSLNMAGFDIRDCGTLGQTLESCDQLYTRDLVTGTTTLVSARVGTLAAEVESGGNMSPDGRYVAYGSRRVLWFVDTQTGTRTKLPIAGAADGDRDGTAQYIDVSDDGRYVTFTTEATNVILGDTNGFPDVVRFDRQTGAVTALARTPNGSLPSRGSGFAIDDNCGSRTAFWSWSADLVGGDTNDSYDIFVRDASGSIRRASVEARDGTQSNHDSSVLPILSGNGRFVFFQSDAWNLVPDDVEGYRDSFVLDLGDTTSCGDTPPPPNHAPVADSATEATDEDVAAPVTLAGSDVDGDALTYAIVADPAHGTLSGTGADRTYTPAANWSGTDTFTFTASDGLLDSQVATVTITVRPVNDAPAAALAAPAAISEGATGTLILATSDADGDALTYTWATDGGTLVPSAGGTSATLAGGDGPATRHVTVQVSDGTTRVTVAKDVAVANVAPAVTIVRPAPGAHTTVGTAIELSATTSDAGGDDVTCTIRWGDGSAPVPGCAAAHVYSLSGTYDATITASDGDGGVTTAAISVAVDPRPDASWSFEGFFQPVDNLPVVNTVKAGSTVPLKFGLGGNHGMAIFAPGYPASVAHPCGTSPAEDAIEQLATPGESTLTYDAATGRYHFNWKTEKGWSGQCRTLVIRFVDGTVARAEFRFK